MSLTSTRQRVFTTLSWQPAFETAGDTGKSSSCLPIWDSKDAKFTNCALPYISAIPLTIIAGVLALGIIGRLFDRFRPQWTRRFIVERVPEVPELQSNDKGSPWRWLALLFAFSLSGLASSFVELILSPRDISNTLMFAAWAIVMMFVGIVRPQTAPGTLCIFYLSIFAVELLDVLRVGSSARWRDVPHYVEFASAFVSIITILQMRLRVPSLPSAAISPVGDPPSHHLRSPEDDLRLWHFLSMSWMLPMIRLGKKRTLNEEDVWQLAYEFQHARLYEKFAALSGTVVRRLLKANGLDICILSISASTETVCEYLQPVMLQQLLAAMETPLTPKRVPLTYALIILILRLITAQAEVFNTWFGRRAYERSRGELILMVYEKALSRKNVIGVDDSESKAKSTPGDDHPDVSPGSTKQLTPPWRKYLRWSSITSWFKLRKSTSTATEARQKEAEPASMGKILNICRGDVYEVAQRFWEIENMIETGLGLILSTVLVWKLLGPTCFIGIITVLLGQFLNAIFTRIQLRVIKRVRGATDGRLQVTAQYIEAIRHLRWYGWHSHWIQQIHDAREHELHLKVLRIAWSTVMNFTNSLTNGLFPVAALYGYTVLGGKPLSIDILFPALQLFARLASNLREIPEIIQQLANAYIAMSRIEDFMEEPDREENESGASGPPDSIQLRACKFAWPDQKNPVLSDLNLEFNAGFHVIFGPTGCGKTALLQGLLGEMDKLAGTARVPNKMIAYCSQTPWLQSMSIRDNILFSAPYDEWRYRNVLDACELLPDLTEFEHGDLSAIGENGIGLSGGQKARVALARAVYSQARLLLLDDPISALDFNTAENIISKCFDGPLVKSRTVILVTHRTDMVHHLATQRIEIGNGQASVSSNDASISEEAPNSHENGHANGNETKKDDTGFKKLDADMTNNKFEDEEHRAEFGVKARVYWQYIKAGKLKWWVCSALLLVLWRLSAITVSWFLKEWGEAYSQVMQTYIMFSHDSMILPIRDLQRSGVYTATAFFNPLKGLPSPEENVMPWLWVYFGLSAFIALVQWISQMFLAVLMYVSSKNIFSRAITKVSQANFRFYDVTPVGRLMNRLTSDIGTVDSNIAQQLYFLSYQGITWMISLIAIGSVTPAFLIFSVAFVAFTVWIFNLFLPTSQSLRRLETVSLSPLFAKVSEERTERYSL